MFWQEIHSQGRYHVDGISHIARAFIHDLRKHQELGNKVHLFESGTGTGRHIIHAKNFLNGDGEFTATDISHNVIAHLAQYQIAALQGDMRDCPVKTGVVTHAISWRALHLLDDSGRSHTLNEKRRILQPHGKLLLAVRSHKDFWNGIGEQIEEGTFTILGQHHMPNGLTFDNNLPPQTWHFYSANELRTELKIAGFSLDGIDHLTELPGTFKHKGVTNSYWVVRAERERRDLLWTGVSFI